MSSNELQALFSNLKPRSQEGNTASPGYASLSHQSSRPSSSTFFHTAPVPSTPPPPFSSTASEFASKTNENMSQQRATGGATAQNLLNLLNFGASQNSNNTSAQPTSTSAPAPISGALPLPEQSNQIPLSASDLVAKFMSPTVSSPKIEHKDEEAGGKQAIFSTSQNPLLELLNKKGYNNLSQNTQNGAQKEGEQDAINPAEIPVQSIEVPEELPSKNTFQERHISPAPVFGSSASRDHTPLRDVKPTSTPSQENKPIFTYKNPFEALNASRTQTPVASSNTPQNQPTPAPFEFQQAASLPTPTAISSRKKLTPKLRSQRSTNSAARETSPLSAQTPIRENTSYPIRTAEEVQPKVETVDVAQAREVSQEQVIAAEAAKDANEPLEENTQEKQDESGDWEDADELPDRDSIIREVPVYNFPIKAFVSITLQLGASSDIGIREDGVMEISRLKKDFDQLDRSLAAATAKYITYAFVKNGGMRIIRQDDGSDRHVFKNSHDRIFAVAFCTTALNAPASENQAVLGTGISGAVYYASVSKEGNDLFEKNQLDLESLIFPPHPQGDENTAGGVLKTRAKRSSRHPEYFAIGRGKSIHFIWPATALSPRYGINDTNRTVDIDKFYSDRPLQISTGKAGKDFTFSEDDTLIVSLDKTGRLRFWDIRNLVDETNATAARVNPVVIDTPILSLSTASPAEKSWPTSVTFVDKVRPYKKGGPLRYVLVGLRQNHTLQLWDIALGKAVQELNFPHDNETDGICSVNYHPDSGIIVVSHPTRNSIFFIHLSAPRYTLSSQLSQATYVQRIAAKDTELPKPESTACMSGIREISFAEKGQLRSVELLPVQKPNDGSKDEPSSLFELYVVHSKGVTCLGINREDLGWNSESKVLHPIDAQQEGLVSLKELKLGSVIEEPLPSNSPLKEVVQPVKSSKKKSKKASQPVEEVANGVDEAEQPSASMAPMEPVPESTPLPETAVQEVVVPKESKKAKKKAEKAAQLAESSSLQSDVVAPSSPQKEDLIQTNGTVDPTPIAPQSARENVEERATGISEELLSKELRKIERAVSGEFKKELDSLYQNIQTDRATQDSSSASRQEAILRLVSSSLSTNVEKSLSRILALQLQEIVLPAVVKQVSTAITENLALTMHQVLPSELDRQLPAAINNALHNSISPRQIADLVAQKVLKHVDTQVTDVITKTVTPVFTSIATTAAEKASSGTEAHLTDQIRQLQMDRAADSERLDKLENALQGIAGILQALSDSQVAFQGQILRDRQAMTLSGSSAITTSRQVSTARGTPDPAPISRPKSIRIRSKADIELEEITNLMNEGRYEEGSIKWLQSAQPVKLFDELFVRFTPEYLATDVSPLVAFSVAVTVANSLSTNTDRRLEWISAAFDAVDLQDPEIADLSQHAPSLITSLVQKLESLYMTLAERNPADPILKSIPPLAKKGRDMKTAFVERATGSVAPPLHLAGASF